MTAAAFTTVCGDGKQTNMGGTNEKSRSPRQARSQTSKLIAIIDEDERMQDSLRNLIESTGLVVRCFGSAEEFLESDLHGRAACVIAEIRMPKMSGLDLQAKLKEEDCDIRIIFITADGDAGTRIQAMRAGAVEFLTKPFDHQCLLKILQAALDI